MWSFASAAAVGAGRSAACAAGTTEEMNAATAIHAQRRAATNDTMTDLPIKTAAAVVVRRYFAVTPASEPARVPDALPDLRRDAPPDRFDNRTPVGYKVVNKRNRVANSAGGEKMFFSKPMIAGVLGAALLSFTVGQAAALDDWNTVLAKAKKEGIVVVHGAPGKRYREALVTAFDKVLSRYQG